MSPMRKTHVSDKFVRIYGEKVGKLPERVQFGCSETHNARRGRRTGGRHWGWPANGRRRSPGHFDDRMGGGEAISRSTWAQGPLLNNLIRGGRWIVQCDMRIEGMPQMHGRVNSRECGLPDTRGDGNRRNLGVWRDHHDLCHFSFAWQKNGCYRDARSGRPLRGFSTRFWGAGMVKLVDTPDLGSGAARRGSSSLSTRTKKIAQSVAGSSLACRRMRPQRNEIA